MSLDPTTAMFDGDESESAERADAGRRGDVEEMLRRLSSPPLAAADAGR